MATRSRTLLFLQTRASFQRFNVKHSEDVSLLGHSEIAIEMTALPPAWVDLVEEVESDIKKLGQTITELDSLHKKNLLMGLDDSSFEEGRIQELTAIITKSFQGIQQKIKQCHDANTNLSKNIQISLATKLQELSLAFRKSQSQYLQKLQGRENRNKSLLSSTMEGMEEDDLDSVFKDASLAVVESNDREIERRNKEINEIVKSVNALAVLFKEIQTMVIDQGTVLDRIDYNIEQVNVYTEGAYEELVKAAKYQDTTKAKVCIAILVVIVFILLMIAIFKPRR